VRAAQRQRNKLQHFGLEESAEAIESVAIKALDFILGFLDDHVAPDADPADALLLEETMPKVREQLGQIRTLVQHRMDRLTPQLAHLLVVQCPRCAQTAFVPDHLPRCAYCGETWEDARTAAEEYASIVLGLNWYDVKDGGERPVEDCPECGGTPSSGTSSLARTDSELRCASSAANPSTTSAADAVTPCSPRRMARCRSAQTAGPTSLAATDVPHHHDRNKSGRACVQHKSSAPKLWARQPAYRKAKPLDGDPEPQAA
jgi:ribosomal protein S27AE